MTMPSWAWKGRETRRADDELRARVRPGCARALLGRELAAEAGLAAASDADAEESV